MDSIDIITLVPIAHANIASVLPLMLKTEQQFSPSLRTSKMDMVDILEEELSVMIMLDGNYIGNILAARIDLKEVAHFGMNFSSTAQILYIYSIAIEPHFQRKGYGKQALHTFCESVRAAGFTYVVGHFMDGASTALAISLGWQVHTLVENWEQSEKVFAYCVLAI